MKSIFLVLVIVLVGQISHADAYLDYLARQSDQNRVRGVQNPYSDLIEGYRDQSNEVQQRNQRCTTEYNSWTGQYETRCQ